MKPEQFARELEKLLPQRVRSLILFGSAAAGDFIESRSDYNLLLVTERSGLDELRLLAPLVRRWLKAGNPPPVPMTLHRLQRSADVFPLEILDMKENHRLLLGADVLENLPVSDENLRHQLEFELKSKLLQLQGKYWSGSGARREITRLMVDSLASFLVLGRGMLRLLHLPPPDSKLESIQLLSRHWKIRADVFEQAHRLKAGEKSLNDAEVERLFGEYLAEIERWVDELDDFFGQTAPASS